MQHREQEVGDQRGRRGQFLFFYIMLSSSFLLSLFASLKSDQQRLFKGNVLCHLKGSVPKPVDSGTQDVCWEYGVWTGHVHGVQATESLFPGRVPPLLLPGVHAPRHKHRPRYCHVCLTSKWWIHMKYDTVKTECLDLITIVNTVIYLYTVNTKHW